MKSHLLTAVCAVFLLMLPGPAAHAESAEDYLSKGQTAFNKKDYKTALHYFDEVVDIDPGSYAGYSWRGTAYGHTKQYDKALADYDMALKLKPKYAMAYFNRGCARVKLKQHDGAESDLKKAMNLGKKDAGLYNALGYNGERSGNAVAARLYYEKALKLEPGNKQAANNLRRLNKKEGKAPTAGIPSKSEPGDVRALMLLGASADFKLKASGSLDAALASVGGADKLRFITEGKTYKSAPQIWAYFFSGAFILMGNPTDMQPVSAFYNPYLDSAVIVRWQLEPLDRPPAIADAFFVYGADFIAGRAGKATAAPRWARYKQDVGRAIGTAHRTFVARFNSHFPASRSCSSSFAQTKRLAAKTMQHMESLAAVQMQLLVGLATEKSSISSRLELVSNLLTFDDEDILADFLPDDNPFTVKELLALPDDFKNRCYPTFVVPGDEKTVVLLTTTAVPQFGLQVSMDNSGSELDISSLSLYSLQGPKEVAQ